MGRNKIDVDEDLEVEFSWEYTKRLLSYVKPYKKEMVITLIVMILASVVSLLGPYLVKVAMDTSIPNNDIKGLIVVCCILLLTIVVGAICMIYKIKTMTYVGQGVVKNIEQIYLITFRDYHSLIMMINLMERF